MPLPGPPAEKLSPPPNSVCKTHNAIKSFECQPPSGARIATATRTGGDASTAKPAGVGTRSSIRTSPPTYVEGGTKGAVPGEGGRSGSK